MSQVVYTYPQYWDVFNRKRCWYKSSVGNYERADITKGVGSYVKNCSECHPDALFCRFIVRKIFFQSQE